MPEPSHVWQHPWLRVSRLIAVILGTRWSRRHLADGEGGLGWALAERGRLRRAPLWN
jgi:hypothetical protein